MSSNSRRWKNAWNLQLLELGPQTKIFTCVDILKPWNSWGKENTVFTNVINVNNTGKKDSDRKLHNDCITANYFFMMNTRLIVLVFSYITNVHQHIFSCIHEIAPVPVCIKYILAYIFLEFMWNAEIAKFPSNPTSFWSISIPCSARCSIILIAELLWCSQSISIFQQIPSRKL